MAARPGTEFRFRVRTDVDVRAAATRTGDARTRGGAGDDVDGGADSPTVCVVETRQRRARTVRELAGVQLRRACVDPE